MEEGKFAKVGKVNGILLSKTIETNPVIKETNDLSSFECGHYFSLFSFFVCEMRMGMLIIQYGVVSKFWFSDENSG